MSTRLAPRGRPRAAVRARQRGLVMVTGMLFLVVVTLLALTLFRSSGLLERIAANTRDKQRSFESAQAALQYGEWWLGLGNGGMGTTCTGLVSANTNGNIHVCSNAIATPTELPWANGYTYTPPNFTVNTSGGQTASGDINYQALPGFYLEYLGIATDGKTLLYKVTAYGYGGIADTGTVVRSVYSMTPKVNPVDGL